jgi:hypothetical protein
MPFNGNVYTPPAGAESATPGAIVQSATWNSIFTDMAAAFTTLMTQANSTPTWSNILAPNGGFSIWQRGAGSSASFSVNASTTQYTADRWYLATGVNQACVVAAATGLTGAAPVGHAAKITRTSGQTGVGAVGFGYPLTGDEVNRIRGQMVSFSGAAKAGANWSPASGTLTINLYVGTGTPQKASGFTNLTTSLSISVNIAAGAENLSITGTSSVIVPVSSTQAELQVSWTPVGTAGTDDSITLDQFCLVAGAIVQSFEDIPFDISLRECKRFFRKSFPYGTAPAQGAGQAGALATYVQAATQFSMYVNLEPIEMVATAAVTTYNPAGASANWYNPSTTASVAAGVDTTTIGPKGFMLYTTATVSAANEILNIHYSADSGL